MSQLPNDILVYDANGTTSRTLEFVQQLRIINRLISGQQYDNYRADLINYENNNLSAIKKFKKNNKDGQYDELIAKLQSSQSNIANLKDLMDARLQKINSYNITITYEVPPRFLAADTNQNNDLGGELTKNLRAILNQIPNANLDESGNPPYLRVLRFMIEDMIGHQDEIFGMWSDERSRGIDVTQQEYALALQLKPLLEEILIVIFDYERIPQLIQNNSIRTVILDPEVEYILEELQAQDRVREEKKSKS